MTRKDFKMIADVLHANRPDYPTREEADTLPVIEHVQKRARYTVWSNIVREMADALAKTNGRFDHGRFIDACEK